MTTPPPSPNPLGDAAATTDQVGLAARAMLAGMLVGLAAFAVVVAPVRYLAEASRTSDISSVLPDDPQILILQFGLPLGLLLAGATAYWLMAPISQPWRRGGLAIVTALAGLVASMVITVVAHQIGGITGLGIVSLAALLCAARAVASARREARRARRAA